MDYGNSNTTGRRLKHFFSPCLLVLLLFSLLSNLANADLTKLDEGKTLFFENKLEEAQHALEISSAQGSPEAFYYLALINRKRNGDELKTLEHLKAAADDGYTLAMHEIAKIYELGKVVPKDMLVALDWHRRAERNEQSNSPIITFISNPQENFEGTRGAVSVLDKLTDKAESGNVESQYKVAKSFDFGIHGIHNGDLAVRWYRTAADNGHEYSQVLMGYLFCRGVYVAKDIEVATEWFRKSGKDIRCK